MQAYFSENNVKFEKFLQRIEKLNASMDQYHTTAVYLKDHMMVLVNVFAITLFQRFALFTATALVCI